MKKFSLILFVSIVFLGCKPKKENDNSIATVKNFMTFYQNTFLSKEKLYVVQETIEGRQYDWTWNAVNIDSLKSKDFKRVEIKKWNKLIIPKATFLAKKELEQVPFDTYKHQKFYNKVKGFYDFGQPYVSADNNYVMIYISYVCGNRCGYDTIQLFKRTNNSWKLIETYMNGIY